MSYQISIKEQMNSRKMFKCGNIFDLKCTESGSMPITAWYSFDQTYFLHANVFPLKHQHKFHHTKFFILATNPVTFLH